jgi:hypothetical protein
MMDRGNPVGEAGLKARFLFLQLQHENKTHHI